MEGRCHCRPVVRPLQCRHGRPAAAAAAASSSYSRRRDCHLLTSPLNPCFKQHPLKGEEVQQNRSLADGCRPAATSVLGGLVVQCRRQVRANKHDVHRTTRACFHRRCRATAGDSLEQQRLQPAEDRQETGLPLHRRADSVDTQPAPVTVPSARAVMSFRTLGQETPTKRRWMRQMRCGVPHWPTAG